MCVSVFVYVCEVLSAEGRTGAGPQTEKAGQMGSETSYMQRRFYRDSFALE